MLIDLNLVPPSFKANNKIYAPITAAYLCIGHINPDIYFGMEEPFHDSYICESFEEWLSKINQMKLEKLL